MVQWLRLHTYTAGDMGSIPGGGTEILHATWSGQKKRGKDTVKTSTECVTRGDRRQGRSNTKRKEWKFPNIVTITLTD